MPTTIQLTFKETIHKETVKSYRSESLQTRIGNHALFNTRKLECVSKDTIFKDTSHLIPFRQGNLNGLAEAFHLAYDQHHGLTLKPDHLFITILQGLSIHIGRNPEKYRNNVGLQHTQPGTKEKISVRRDQFELGNPNNDWEGVFPEFVTKIGEKVDDRLSPFLLGKFSTSSPSDVAVTALSIMDVYKSYFEYGFFTGCGIPEIILEGEEADWILLKERVQGIFEKFDDLGFWTDQLYPILDEFISASNGSKINEQFWKSIYKYEGRSGGSDITGWIRSLYPYLNMQDYGAKVVNFVQNPYINWKEPTRPYSGLTLSILPNSFTSTPFLWNYWDVEFKMSFVGGLLGVSVNASNDHVSPLVGWAILHE